MGGYDSTGGAYLYFEDNGILLADATNSEARGGIYVVPAGTSSISIWTIIVYSSGGAVNIYGTSYASGGGCGEVLAHSTNSTLPAHTIALPAMGGGFANGWACIDTFSLPVEAGDNVIFRFVRDATNVADTLNTDIYVYGWLII